MLFALHSRERHRGAMRALELVGLRDHTTYMPIELTPAGTEILQLLAAGLTIEFSTRSPVHLVDHTVTGGGTGPGCALWRHDR